MKFINNINKSCLIIFSSDFITNHFFIDENFENNYYYTKNIIKNRKCIYTIRPGVSSNVKKSSIKRDLNALPINQFININTKKGNKSILLKNLNTTFENLNLCLSFEIEDFKNLKNYKNIVNDFNSDITFSNFNTFFNYLISDLNCIFDIKASKNNKKLKLKNKYSYEIIYIPKERRLKHTINSLSFYKEQFKNYNFWERIFWSFLKIITNKNESFLKKKRDYICLKSLKFFKKTKKQKLK